MSKTLVSLLVGMHFRPPAKQVVAHLPSGASLRLQAEPENPYDAEALQVWCDFGEVPSSQLDKLEEELEGTGFTVEDLTITGELQLGYVAASGGKPLLKAGLQTGNKEFNQALANGSDWAATFTVGPDGAPMVQLLELEPQ